MLLIAGLAVINASGTFSQLTAAHVGNRAVSSATLTMQGTNLDSRIEVAAAKLADVDRRISAIDGIVAGAAQRGRANTATSIMSDQRKARAATFADLISSRIVVRGPKLRLNAAFAQAMGLALHELTTNVGKYGALSKDTGHVDIGWGTDCDIFAMSWTECDGPAVSAP